MTPQSDIANGPQIVDRQIESGLTGPLRTDVMRHSGAASSSPVLPHFICSSSRRWLMGCSRTVTMCRGAFSANSRKS